MPSIMAEVPTAKPSNPWLRFLWSLGLGVGAWSFSLILASILTGFPRAPEGQFALVMGAWGHGAYMIALVFLVSGVLLGAVADVMAAAFGAGAIFMMPILAVIEMVQNPFSHSIWPME